MSFRLKTILGIACIEGVLLLLLVWMGLSLMYASQEDELMKRASTSATLFATATKDAVLSSDLASLESFVDEVLKNPGMVYARVVDRDGTVLAERGDGEALKRPFVADRHMDDAKDGDGVFDVLAKIREGGTVYGHVQLGLDIADLYRLLAEARTKSAGAALLEIGLVALFSFAFGTYLTRQLKGLKEASERVSSGDLDHQIPVRGRDELAQAAVAFNRMSSQVKQRTCELAAKADDLERSNRELNQFAYIAAHDLKAPLRAIANLSRWIEEDIGGWINGNTRRQMDLLRGRVYRMEALIDGILEYSRVGRVALDVERVDVAVLLDGIIESLAPPESFIVKIGPGMPIFTTARDQLSQVFVNLIGNAIRHYDRPDGCVQVAVREDGDFYEFSVADEGPGIPTRYHDKVFQIFQTLQARDHVESTGVGLPLVKKIVENQGGSIALESEAGQGATFRFTWPKRHSVDREQGAEDKKSILNFPSSIIRQAQSTVVRTAKRIQLNEGR